MLFPSRGERLPIENAFGLVDYRMAFAAFNAAVRIGDWCLFSRLRQEQPSGRHPFQGARKFADVPLGGRCPACVAAFRAPATFGSG